MTRPLADKIVEAARQSLPVNGAEIARAILAADLRLLTDIERQITEAEAAIETVLPATPFDVLRTAPGWDRSVSGPTVQQSVNRHGGRRTVSSTGPPG